MNKKRLMIMIAILLFFISIVSIQYLTYNLKATQQTSEENPVQLESPVKLIKTRLAEKAEEMKPKKTTITLTANGDIMFHTSQIIGAYNQETGTYDFDSTFEPVKRYIESADIAVGNFETVTAGPEHGFRGYPRFNSPKVIMETLKKVGYDILTTANNHALDRGKEGIVETIDNIEAYGLKNIGTYKEPGTDIFIQEVKGIKLGLLSYTYGCNGLESLLTEEELGYMVNIIDEEKIKDEVNRAKSKNVDFVIAFMHWGNEYHREPTNLQRNLAKKMMDWGVDVIFGSHPHVIQNSELITHNKKEKFIIYSMGNFVSNQRYETVENSYTEDGVIVQLELEKNLKTNESYINQVKYIPTWVNRYKENGKYRYEILPVEDYLNEDKAGAISVEAFSRIEKSFDRTMEKMDQR